MKKIMISEAETLEIQFQDGVAKKLVFNMKAVALFQNALADSGKRLDEIREQSLLAYILYAGINAVEENGPFSMEEANAMAYIMNPPAGSQIIEMFIDSISKGMSEEQKQMQKKLLAQFLNKE